MDFNSLISWGVSQPWSFAVPFVAAVLVDWAAGAVLAVKAGTFKKENVFDWVQTTVGWKKAVAVVGSVAVAYFLNSQHDVNAALVPLIAVNGAAFLVVLDDIKVKVKELVSPSKPPAVVILSKS